MLALVKNPPSTISVTNNAKKVNYLTPSMATNDYDVFPILRIWNEITHTDYSDHFYTYLAMTDGDAGKANTV